jgi:HEPN domain-containing protein
MADNSNHVQAWINKANSDLGIAELVIKEGCNYPEAVCFHCQQYVEKIIKAKIIACGENVPRTHGLSALLDILDAKGIEISVQVYEWASMLEDYAVGIRYPGDYADPTKEEALEAYDIAIKLTEYLLKLF